MRLPRPLAFTALAALIAGLGVAAYAEAPKVHVLRVALPDGSIRQIRYIGDVPPRIVLIARPAATPTPGSPFAGFDRIAAMMDAQAAAMMRQVSAMTAQSAAAAGNGDVQLAALGAQPAGVGYTSVSTTIVDGRACTTRVQATSLGAGKAPRLLRQVSGDGCDSAVRTPAPPATPHAGIAPAAPAAPPAAPRPPAADTI